MNKAKFSTTVIVLMGLLLFLPLFVAATAGITDTSVKVIADYSKFADEDDDFITVTTESFTVTNDGIGTITVKATGLPTKYSSQSTTVDAGETKAVTLTVEVPHRKSPGQEKIGTIVITDAGNTQLDSADLIQETLSMLELSELEVKYVDYAGKIQKDRFKVDDGDNYALEQEVKPYTDITFNFDLKNLFDRDYKNQGKLEKIEIAVDVDDQDLLGAGFKDTYGFEDIEAGKEAKYPITFLINQEIQPDTYTMEFTITAEDGEGIEYEIKKELEVEIQLDDDDIRIVNAKILPETATICDKEVTLAVEVHNFGSDDQDKVMVTLENEELNLNQKIQDIAIDAHTEDDDSWQKTFTIALENTKTKIYFLDLTTYISSTLTDAEVVQLELKPCAAAQEPVVEEEQSPEPSMAAPENESTGENADKESMAGNVIRSVEKISYTSSDYLVALMLITIAVVAAMIVLMLVILFKE